jgi:heme/copper-type cytochrome/quinol oxidase subunit 2
MHQNKKIRIIWTTVPIVKDTMRVCMSHHTFRTPDAAEKGDKGTGPAGTCCNMPNDETLIDPVVL